MMFLAKKHISRRSVLRGMGVTLALPLLDSMVPAQTPLRQTAASPKSRLACIEMVHGAAGSTVEGARQHYWSPRGEGADFDFSYSLEPLAPFRDYVTIISGTDARQADAFTPSEGGADHFRSSAVFLTAAHPKQTTGPDICAGVSIDQLYAQRFGQDTRLPSIQLCIDNFGLSGSCGFDYSCIYSETISWASPTTPLTMTVNPRVAFENLFGGSRPDRSVLDAVTSAAAQLRRTLGPADRTRLNAHLEEIRSLERRIQAIEKHNAIAEKRELPTAPLGVPDSWEQHVKLMFDLQVLAMQADITRVITFQLAREVSTRTYPQIGVAEPHHATSHHQNSPEKLAKLAKINAYHVSLFAYLLGKLEATKDGDGTLLDHSLYVLGSGLGNPDVHDHSNLPIVVAGGGSMIKGGRHIKYAEATPLTNLHATLLDKVGVPTERFADSTGKVSEMLEPLSL